MEYTIDEIRTLYQASPAKVYQKLNTDDRLRTNDSQLAEIERILKNCKISYRLKSVNQSGSNIHEIIVV